MTKLQYPLCGPQVCLQRAARGPRAACLTCLTYTMALKLYKCPKRQNCQKRVESIPIRYGLLAIYFTYNSTSLLVRSGLRTKNLKMRNFAQNINSVSQQVNELGHSDSITREVTKHS